MNDSAHPISVLLLEDDPLDAELAKSCLKAGGVVCDVTLADTRASFETAFRECFFDLILADFSLPDFDGLSALKIVRANSQRVPFIFVSGVLGEDVAVESLRAGATDYVTKHKLSRLVPAVRRALTEYAEYASRERAEQELRHIEQRFRSLTDSLPAMVWTCDVHGNLTFANTTWMQCVGSAATWLDEEVIHPADFPSCRREWSRAQEAGTPVEIECRFKVGDGGSYRWHLVRAVPVGDEVGKTFEWVGTCTDLEEQKRRDAELKTAEKLALTGRMASVIAHEINNPLEAITNILYLLRSEQTQSAQGDAYFTMAEHELLRISGITKQTLQWSREEASLASVPVEDLIEESVRLFSGKVKNKDIVLKTRIDPKMKVHVVVGEIRQVLANLISNAVDAVDLGGRINIVATQDTGSYQYSAKIEVCDDGQGIAPDKLPELFRPFQSTKGMLGNGLGLYVCKQIIDRHGGQLLVDSEVNRGTSMRILLPLGVPS
ncbi:MAG: ATP-binding response regulator [Janthinobacterium lividum]